ncbi:hypothetical protein E3N88_31268 [Mikania micrantha]|uniref:Uncharacterized protein n=1 Tax=Mikania micrantha TaxID=192012 RepID=A0A5N6MRW7_9ASTR|nr:hypothetical protein E3N88_31268 [Mikania micrantha]
MTKKQHANTNLAGTWLENEAFEASAGGGGGTGTGSGSGGMGGTADACDANDTASEGSESDPELELGVSSTMTYGNL